MIIIHSEHITKEDVWKRGQEHFTTHSAKKGLLTYVDICGQWSSNSDFVDATRRALLSADKSI